LLEGDEVGNRRVKGFAWKAPRPGDRSNHHNDVLLLDGDEQMDTPPDRAVPQTSEGAVAVGLMPPDDLLPEERRKAGSVDLEIAVRADALLDLPGAPWEPLVRPLFAAVHATGHRMWVAGGAARDVVMGVAPQDVNDLDLSGTVAPGRFSDITYQTLRALQMSECRTTVTPSSLVCAVVKPGSMKRLIEYRGLSRGGFRFPVVGSRLAEDARHRDYSFNALLYDIFDHEIYDPCGHGFEDLLGAVRRFMPLNQSVEPLNLGHVVLRTMKFALRWEGDKELDLEPARVWMSKLPPELWSSLTENAWDSLRKTWEEITAPVGRQLEFASTLPQPARILIESVIGRV